MPVPELLTRSIPRFFCRSPRSRRASHQRNSRTGRERVMMDHALVRMRLADGAVESSARETIEVVRERADVGGVRGGNFVGSSGTHVSG